MKRLLLALAALSVPSAVFAADFTCAFTTECFEAEQCSDSTFAIDVMLGDEKISTEFGALTIVALKQSDALKTLFATGSGAEYLLSITSDAARLTTHMNDGPLSVTYLGACEGAF